MNRTFWPALALTLVVAVQPGVALAYIGPGVGAGALAAALGVVGSVFLALFAIIWYPVKRLFKGRKKPAPPAAKAKTD